MKTQDRKPFTNSNPRHRRVLESLGRYLVETGDHDIYGGEKPFAKNRKANREKLEATAADWAELSRIKPSDMPRWWKAGAFEPEAAQGLIEAGIGAGLAKRSCGEKGEEIDTFAYHVSIGNLTVAEAAEQILA